jgi:hypothetical protein
LTCNLGYVNKRGALFSEVILLLANGKETGKCGI